MKTIYAVVCEKIATKEFMGICGLFKDIKKAQEALLFWEEHKTYDVCYGINNITTDLLEDTNG